MLPSMNRDTRKLKVEMDEAEPAMKKRKVLNGSKHPASQPVPSQPSFSDVLERLQSESGTLNGVFWRVDL